MKYTKAIVFLILGFIVGSIVIFLFSATRMEELYQEREQLKVKVFETTERLSKLEEMWESKEEQIIKEIKIELKTEKNTFAELSLKQSVHEIVKDLVGEKVKALNPLILINMIEGRIIQADNKKYQLDLKAVTISEILSFYIKANLLDETTI